MASALVDDAATVIASNEALREIVGSIRLVVSWSIWSSRRPGLR